MAAHIEATMCEEAELRPTYAVTKRENGAPVISALGRQRQEDCEFKASLY
jgi:hypothetical protein